MMDNVTITVTETKGLERRQRPVRLGVPMARGVLFDAENIALLDDKGKQLPVQSTATAHWDENSIRWILLDFEADVAKSGKRDYQLYINPAAQYLKPVLSGTVTCTEKEDTLEINTGIARFSVDKRIFRPFKQVAIDSQEDLIDDNRWLLKTGDGKIYQPVIKSFELPEQHETRRCQVYFTGEFTDSTSNEGFLDFEASLSFFVNSALCVMEFTLHNSRAAMHKGGFWDLGDPSSVYFESLVCSVDFENADDFDWKHQLETEYQPTKSSNVRLYQDSSGGENWDHHIHIDKNNESTVSFRGYRLAVVNSNSETERIIDDGFRASPIFRIKHKNASIATAAIGQFWQNFPKGISYIDSKLNLEFFPETPKSDHELQGGEQKTHTAYFDFSDNNDHCEQSILPLSATLPLDYYHCTEAMPCLPSRYEIDPIDKIINEGVDGEKSFFWKREKADEYGWRNFGELWADHETLEHDNDDSLVSHYNNQYDPIYGYARQYVLTGDERWFNLMNDLAHHVLDIDIYHTEQDKPEYNHGMFWHTDHYLDGRNCTHRSFSKYHMESHHVEQSGGGPGSEHCYTTGLLYHYFLTGERRSKSSLLLIADWSGNINQRSNTILQRLFRFATHDVKVIQKLIRGQTIINYEYPLSRGTANYIQCMLDCYLLNSDANYLNLVGNIIRNTFGPSDDIALRNLMSDIESNWHYIVFLQSVTRYIEFKIRISEFDDDLTYCLQAFNHYMKWVNCNEKPYLESKALLVYPNLTWVAQDLRKVNVLNFYSRLIGSNLEKAEQIFEYILPLLSSDNNSSTTRILALLMQSNCIYPDDVLRPLLPESLDSNIEATSIRETGNRNTIGSILGLFFSDLWKRTKSLSIKEEISWLTFRLK